MTDTLEHGAETLTGRKLGNAMNLLLSDMADAIDAKFPHTGKSPEGMPDTQAYINNYEAHAAAYKLLDALLLGQPADIEHRRTMWEFATQAYELYGARVDDDEVIRKCIGRAADDNKPDTPEQKQRTGNKKRAVSAPQANTKAPGKS